MNRHKIYRYRGWNKGKGDWIYGIIEGDAKAFPEEAIETLCQVEPGSVGEYTGFRDRVGDMIYDGDILLQSDDVEDSWYTVHWDEDEDRWGAYDDAIEVDFDLKYVMSAGPTPEIVGNVWEKEMENGQRKEERKERGTGSSAAVQG